MNSQASPSASGPRAAREQRALRFCSLGEIVTEAERLAAADRSGRLRHTGEWTCGQAFGHLAGWINFGFDGYPVSAPEDLAARARARKESALRHGLLVGFRMAWIPEGTAATERLPTDEGLGRLRAAIARLEKATPIHPHPFFGPLTREEWLLLHLRHAELHLSFQHPG